MHVETVRCFFLKAIRRPSHVTFDQTPRVCWVQPLWESLRNGKFEAPSLRRRERIGKWPWWNRAGFWKSEVYGNSEVFFLWKQSDDQVLSTLTRVVLENPLSGQDNLRKRECLWECSDYSKYSAPSHHTLSLLDFHEVGNIKHRLG